MPSGGRSPATVAMTMTEDAKTEKHTVGEPYGAYIKTALQVYCLQGVQLFIP